MKSKFLNFLKEYFSSNYLLSVPNGFKFQIPFLVFFCFLIIFACGFKIYISKKYNNIPIYKRLSKWVFRSFLSFGFLGLFLLYVRYEQLGFLSYRALFFVFIICFLAWSIFIIVYFFRKIPFEVESYKEKKRKEKWLPKPKKRK